MRPAPDDSPPLPGFTAPVWRIDCEFEPGWRFVFAELREKSPLPWESPLLIDNTSRRATHSSILVTAPAGVVLSVASLPES